MRILSPEDYGLAAIGATLIALIALISEFGFGTAVVQAKEITREQCASVFGAALLFGLASYVLLAGLSPLAGNFFNDQRVASIIQLSGLTFVLAALSTIPDAMLRRDLNFKTLSLIDFASTIVSGLVTYLLALESFNYWSLVFGALSYSTFRTLALHSVVSDRVFPSFRIGPAIQLVKFGGQVAIARLAGYAATQSDIILAGRFLGKETLGLYTVALDLALMPLNKVMSVVNQIALPALAKTSRDQPEKQGYQLAEGLRLVAYIVFPSLWGIAAIAPWLIPELLGNKWIGAVLPLQIIAIALPIRVISNFVSTATVSFGRPDIEVKDKLTSAIIFPIAFFTGVQFGVLGLAGAWCVALPLAVVINLRRTKNAFGIGLNNIAHAVAKPVIYSLTMTVIILVIGATLKSQIAGWLIISTMIFSGATIYGSIFWINDRKNAQLIIKTIRGR